MEELLGDDFVRFDRRKLGAVDSAHETAFGTYKGQEVAAKAFYSDAADPNKANQRVNQKALKEMKLEEKLAALGIRGVEPISVVKPRQTRTAVLMTKYIPNLLGANTLSLEADPQTAKGVVLARPLGAIATTLGQLHGYRITHGDPQMKNFGYLTHEVNNWDLDHPLTLDLEAGFMHGSHNRGNEYFERLAIKDVGRMAISLGDRQYGGADHDLASDIFRETVLMPYEHSPASEILGRQAMGEAIDLAESEFIRARNTALAAHGHISTKVA